MRALEESLALKEHELQKMEKQLHFDAEEIERTVEQSHASGRRSQHNKEGMMRELEASMKAMEAQYKLSSVI